MRQRIKRGLFHQKTVQGSKSDPAVQEKTFCKIAMDLDSQSHFISKPSCEFDGQRSDKAFSKRTDRSKLFFSGLVERPGVTGGAEKTNFNAHCISSSELFCRSALRPTNPDSSPRSFDRLSQAKRVFPYSL